MTPAAVDWLQLILGLATMAIGASILAAYSVNMWEFTVAEQQDAGEEFDARAGLEQRQ